MPKRIFGLSNLIEKPYRKSSLLFYFFPLVNFLFEKSRLLDKVEHKSDFVVSGLVCIVLYENKS